MATDPPSDLGETPAPEVVHVDASPFDDRFLDFLVLREEWEDLPDPQGTALQAILDAGWDGTECGDCGRGVGLVIATHEGPHGEEIERAEWRYVALVTDSAGGVVYRCETCTPEDDEQAR